MELLRRKKCILLHSLYNATRFQIKRSLLKINLSQKEIRRTWDNRRWRYQYLRYFSTFEQKVLTILCLKIPNCGVIYNGYPDFGRGNDFHDPPPFSFNSPTNLQIPWAPVRRAIRSRSRRWQPTARGLAARARLSTLGLRMGLATGSTPGARVDPTR